MFSALTITSTKQGFSFDAAESAGAYAVVERIVRFAGVVLRAATHAAGALRVARRSGQPVRLARA
jgi:hypothetical protein